MCEKEFDILDRYYNETHGKVTVVFVDMPLCNNAKAENILICITILCFHSWQYRVVFANHYIAAVTAKSYTMRPLKAFVMVLNDLIG